MVDELMTTICGPANRAEDELEKLDNNLKSGRPEAASRTASSPTIAHDRRNAGSSRMTAGG
jgi:hypothetical protein